MDQSTCQNSRTALKFFCSDIVIKIIDIIHKNLGTIMSCHSYGVKESQLDRAWVGTSSGGDGSGLGRLPAVLQGW